MPDLLTRRSRVTLLRCAALLAMLAGYLDLAVGGLTVAPLLLVASYMVLVPLAILVR